MRLPAYVLAGGLSQRMGVDKATLRVDGEALAARTVRVLQAAGAAPVHLLSRDDRLADLGLPLLLEPAAPHRHPLFGVACGLRHSPEPLALFCPVDLPELAPAHLRPLLDHGAPCVAAVAGRVLPLLALLPRTFADRAFALAQEQRPAGLLTAGLPEIALPALLNLNHPAQLPAAPPRIVPCP